MSGLDRAFIKAYAIDERDSETPPSRPASPSVIPAPHADFFSAAKTATREEHQAAATYGPDGGSPTATTENSNGWFDGDKVLSPYEDQLYTTRGEHSESAATFHVERFAWPDVCERLVDNASDGFDQLIGELAPSGRPAGRRVAVASCRPGEGSTSFTLCLALAAVRAGVSTVIVDADLLRPKLASRLGVLPQFGWDDVLAGRIRLSETLIESVEDELTLLPFNRNGDATSADDDVDGAAWVEQAPTAHPADSPENDRLQTAPTLSGLAPILDELRARFDLVLIDCGPLSSGGDSTHSFSPDQKAPVDTAVLVEDVRLTCRDDVAAACRQLELGGIPCAGIVENFAA